MLFGGSSIYSTGDYSDAHLRNLGSKTWDQGCCLRSEASAIRSSASRKPLYGISSKSHGVQLTKIVVQVSDIYVFEELEKQGIGDVQLQLELHKQCLKRSNHACA